MRVLCNVSNRKNQDLRCVGVSLHKSGLRFDQQPKLLRPDEMQEEKELRKILQDSVTHGKMPKSAKRPYDAV